jgi:hypothetical protein
MARDKGHWKCCKCLVKENALREPNAEGIYEDFGENSSEEEGGSASVQPDVKMPRCEGKPAGGTRCKHVSHR